MKNIFKIALTLFAFALGTLLFNDIFNQVIGGTGIALIVTGFSKICETRSGGVKNIWIVSRENIAAAGFTLTAGEYSAVTMVSGKVFYKFGFDQDSAAHRWTGTNEGNSLSVDNQVEFFLGKLSTLLRNSLQDIADSSPCGMVVIVEDNNNVKWVFGYSENHVTHITEEGRPMKLLTAEADSGKVFADPNGANVIMQSMNNQYPLVYTGNVPV